MILWYFDEDSGEPVQMCKLTRAFSSRKNREWLSLLDVISWKYDNIAAAALRHADFPQVRQSQ